LVETEENRAEAGFGPFAGVRLELGLDVDDEGGADRGEQAGLKTWSTMYHGNCNAETHENQGGVEILVVLLHVLGVVLRCLSFVHGVEIELGVVVLDRLKVLPQSLLDAVWSQLVGPRNQSGILEHTSEGQR
jgi:hypothetical protein